MTLSALASKPQQPEDLRARVPLLQQLLLQRALLQHVSASVPSQRQDAARLAKQRLVRSREALPVHAASRAVAATHAVAQMAGQRGRGRQTAAGLRGPGRVLRPVGEALRDARPVLLEARREPPRLGTCPRAAPWPVSRLLSRPRLRRPLAGQFTAANTYSQYRYGIMVFLPCSVVLFKVVGSRKH